MKLILLNILLFVIMFADNTQLYAVQQYDSRDTFALNQRQRAIVAIAGLTAKGDLQRLKSQLNIGLESGLNVNQIKEVLIHIYAYAGFPRSIRGLQTFMTILDERKANGIVDVPGNEASPVNEDSSKYERGKRNLEKLTGVIENGPKTGYAAFAPTIEKFLKEHLFADIFERNILSFTERELATVSVLSSIEGVEPMLSSHLKICLNIGLRPEQLQQFVGMIRQVVGVREAEETQKVLNDVLKEKIPNSQ
ncbi:alkylhydroperoxidase/carboxymuconolactone decarboxylase family protein YurZ [Chitinophaga dinghuensis]|uniref:Alkylhydroperoxidase/carboxymuconolactone decarboxylase family protein YurZ n=1 Tax=Chitinophaga dinghuensis TaxID=1539050 RepID=A0A327W272_9BACT|nr:carboxymuconolactone decarboxylase family protein [Chitinophaga dinghuensis]RAJ82305.1 alkylhydroperoxidase/carboxymuconolactone decarboxylase family protein YurZ [Chitinophaga dinghuensis]